MDMDSHSNKLIFREQLMFEKNLETLFQRAETKDRAIKPLKNTVKYSVM